MIAFQSPQLTDRGVLAPIFYGSGNLGCEFTFNNIYLWGRQEYAIVGNCLVLFSHWDGQSTYVYPVGNGDHKAAIRLLMDDAQERGIPFRLSGISEQAMAELESGFPGVFRFQPRRSSFDYVYEIDKLADLKGKHLQQKRNHIHRFCDAHPDWRAEPIGPENLEECRQLVTRWYELHGQDDMEQDFLLEKRAIRRAFDAYFALRMRGLAIRTEGRLVAMTMGSLINDSIFDVSFEKAYADLQGAYPIVNREFAQMLREEYPNLQYLNREEDMGLPGLRKAKESYHPAFLVKKFRAYLEEEVC